MKNKIFIGIIFLVAVLSFTVAFSKKGDAGNVGLQVSIDSETVEKGEEIPVTIKVSGTALMKSVDAYVNYDETMLEFVGAKGDCITGSSGVLRIADNFADGGALSAEYSITFRALEVGSTAIRIQETYVESENNHQVNSAVESSATIKIVRNVNENRNTSLKSLEIYPEGLTPDFASSTTSYSMKVDKNVTELIISAVPEDEESVVTVEGNENLSQGKNTVSITVTSLSGEKKGYTIIVNRQ